jgi:hypothetical protein
MPEKLRRLERHPSVRKDVLGKEGRERLGRHELHLAPEQALEQISKSYEAIESFFPRNELDEDIDIAIRSRGVATKGPEDREAANAQAEDLRSSLGHPCLDISARRGLGNHDRI